MEHILKSHEIFKTDFVRGENCHLYDQQGKEYIDFESGCWSAALGYNNQGINQVMKTQIEKVMHLGTRYPNFLAEEAAVEVLKIVGIEQGKCVFLSSGSEAVELGVQIARRVSGKALLLTFTNSFLGSYGSAGRKSSDEWYLFDWSRCNHEQACDCWKEIPFEKIGGFVFEPGGSGTEAVRFPSKQLVQAIAERVKQAGGLLAVNEITTGMGRTGKWFGYQHYDLQPDIVAIGKGLGNGYPVSAVTMKLEIAEKLEQSGFHYVQSHQNDPLGCAIAKEVIRQMRAGQWVEKGNASGAYLLEGLKQLAAKHEVVREARGRGMLLALEFNSHESFSAAVACQKLLERGFLVGYNATRNFLRFDPSLTIEAEDIERFLICMDEILAEASYGPASIPLAAESL